MTTINKTSFLNTRYRYETWNAIHAVIKLYNTSIMVFLFSNPCKTKKIIYITTLTKREVVDRNTVSRLQSCHVNWTWFNCEMHNINYSHKLIVLLLTLITVTCDADALKAYTIGTEYWHTHKPNNNNIYN